MGFGTQCEDDRPVVETGSHLEMLLLCHGWLVSLFQIYSRWRPDYQQDLHDTGRRREYSVASLPRTPAPQNLVLLKIRGKAETLDLMVTALPQILDVPIPQ